MLNCHSQNPGRIQGNRRGSDQRKSSSPTRESLTASGSIGVRRRAETHRAWIRPPNSNRLYAFLFRDGVKNVTGLSSAPVAFWGWEDVGALVGVMGLQKVRDVTLIRVPSENSIRSGFAS